MNLLGRLARFVAPLPATATHSVNVLLPQAFVEDIPSQLIPQSSVCLITSGVFANNNGISPDLLLAISVVHPLSPFTPLRANTPISPAGFSDLFHVWVSGNLFERLDRAGILGSNYVENTRKSGQSGPESLDENGFTKAYSRARNAYSVSTHKIVSLSIWQLIYPTLLPPIAIEFTADWDMPNKPYPYQQVGVKFLVEHESALLGDDMGTGKTVMTVVALRVLFQGRKVRKALIVCPVVVLKVWQKHLRDWAPELSVTVVRGSRDERKLDWKCPAHVYVAAYDSVSSDFLTVVKKKATITCKTCQRTSTFGEKVHVADEETRQFSCPHCHTPFEELPTSAPLVGNDVVDGFDAVVLDEAQYIKNPNASRSRGVKLPIPKYRWALTGTPVETKIADLAGIFSFVKPKYMHYNVSTGEAKRLMEPYFLRRLKKDVLKDLPPKIKQEQWLELDSDQRDEYDRVLRGEVRKLSEIGAGVTKAHIFAVITALKRVCNFAHGKRSSPKSEILVEQIKTIKGNGYKALVFTQWVDEYGVASLESILKPFGVSVIKGGLSDKAREDALQRFGNDPNICILLATVKAGGVGLTLTEANYVFHFDHWWNPATMWQAEDRAHRKGQLRGVNVYSFWTQRTIEERIHQKLQERGLLFDEVVNSLSDTDVERSISTDDWLDMLGVPPGNKLGVVKRP